MMGNARARWLIVLLCALLWPSASAYAQEATITGVVKDTSGGVLPGVTVTATHNDTGNVFVAFTDNVGAFRMPVRTGAFEVAFELPAFATVVRSADLLVGQAVTITIEMKPDTIEESITVTGEAPLINTASSSIGSNIDRSQMSELPLNGRNFVDMTLLAKGSRSNASTDELGGLGSFQLNVDGLRVTQNQTAGFGQPKYSRDAIAELEFIANRFDATMGGSSGTMVNAITKSGTNHLAGTFSGYFRDDSFIAKDFIQNRVLPYNNQQLAWTLGGPIIKNRAHFFGNFEFEREPQTFTHSSQFPSFNIDHQGTRTEKKGGGRGDVQFTPNTRMTVRGNKSHVDMPFDQRYTGGSVRHPSSAIQTNRYSTDLSGVLTHVLSATSINELRVGYAAYWWIQDSVIPWPDHPYPGLTYGTPILQFRGYTIGQAHTNSHEDERQQTFNVRDNFQTSFVARGRHDLKFGGEAGYQRNPVFLCNRCMGIYDVQGGPIPSNIESLFPVWNDISTWNLAAISPLVRSYTLGVGQMQAQAPLKLASGWVQDDWRMGPMTLNLGMRYDFIGGAFGEKYGLEPFLTSGRKNDKDNFAPRLGFTYALTDKTVIRGGAGKFYADPGSWLAYWTALSVNALHPQVLNDGRADFAANPFNGPIPTFDQVAATLCTVDSSANCLRRSVNTMANNYNEIPYSWQRSVGFEHQIGDRMSFEADYVFTGNRAMLVTFDENVSYNPATGLPYKFTDVSKRPYPNWGSVATRQSIGQSNYHGLQTALTRRMGNHWQASATYTLSGQWNLQNAPIKQGCQYAITLTASGAPTCDVPVTLDPGLKEEWYLSPDQRHRVTLNGIWEMPYGFQLSGLYLFGDNGWATPGSGVDFLATGSTSANTSRFRADGSLIPRNSFDMPSLHRVDMRVQKRFALGKSLRIDGMVEVFNLLNHRNLGSFTLVETNARFGLPAENLNIAYQPRIVQFGFRATF
ncbi:MAG: carboxypeptidase regulatory-like domain-containing protein [Vicinamibacterales bacterium]